MIRTPLRPHQIQIVDFAAPLEYAGILAGYGVGKSLCALGIIQRNGWKVVLVVTTKAAVQSTWPEQISEHSNFLYVQLIGSSADKIRIIRHAYEKYGAYTGSQKPVIIFLTNFDGVKGIFQVLSAMKPQVCFADESTKFRNGDTVRAKVMWALGRAVPRRYLMTGFIVTGDGFGTEIYSQIKYLDRGATFGNSYQQFLNEHFEKKRGKWKLKRGAAKKIFAKIKPFCIMMPDTVIKLPPKIYKKIELEPYEHQTEIIEQLKANMKAEFQQGRFSIASVFALYNKSLQVCDGFIFDRHGCAKFFDTPKDAALIEQLEKIGDEKALVWTTFIPTMQKLYKILTHFGYGVLTLYGQTEDPGKVVRMFQHSTRHNILLASIFSGDASITLTESRHSIYYSHWWSGDKRGNSEARIRRMGSLERHKGKPSIYTDIFLRGTIEERVRGTLKSKSDLVTELKKYAEA